jgi:cytochrome c peroxidase
MKKIRILSIKLILIVLSCTALKAEILLNEPILPIPEPEIIFPEQVELGRLLFNDVRLSKGAQLSCASCHSLKMGGQAWIVKKVRSTHLRCLTAV